MSTVFLHVGQCGNQLGQSFWQEVDGWYSRPPGWSAPAKPTAATQTSPQLPFSLLDRTLPCVLIDTESKVVKRCSKMGVLSKKVPAEFCISERAGRGNNWAYGYFGGRRAVQSQSGGHSMVECVQECVRKLVEKCDQFTGSVLFHSIAGGTGSGLGSAILEHLREDYPLSYILSVPVAPFSLGETPLQHYNTVLCLSWLQDYCDAVLMFQNDCVLQQTQKYLSKGAPGRRGSESVSLEDMNRHISHTLCNSLLPVWSAKPHRTTCMEISELVRSLCADPALKFITPVHAQFSKPSNTWDQAISCITHPNSLKKSNPIGKKVSAISLLQISRSCPSTIDQLIPSVSALERKLKQVYNTVSWNPFPVDFWFSYEPHLRDRKTATVLVNSSAIAEYMESVLQRAKLMYFEKAYLHWYERYGCGGNVFQEAFETVQNTIDSYNQLK